jgi:hypothetical protein
VLTTAVVACTPYTTHRCCSNTIAFVQTVLCYVSYTIALHNVHTLYRTLAEQMGGSISFTDNVPHGTVMLLRIPHHPPSLTAAAAAAASNSTTAAATSDTTGTAIADSCNGTRSRSSTAGSSASFDDAQAATADNEALLRTKRVLVSALTCSFSQTVTRHMHNFNQFSAGYAYRTTAVGVMFLFVCAGYCCLRVAFSCSEHKLCSSWCIELLNSLLILRNTALHVTLHMHRLLKTTRSTRKCCV